MYLTLYVPLRTHRLQQHIGQLTSHVCPTSTQSTCLPLSAAQQSTTADLRTARLHTHWLRIWFSRRRFTHRFMAPMSNENRVAVAAGSSNEGRAQQNGRMQDTSAFFVVDMEGAILRSAPASGIDGSIVPSVDVRVPMALDGTRMDLEWPLLSSPEDE